MPFLLLAAAAPAAGPLSVTTTVMAEHRRAAADGTTEVTLVPAGKLTPGAKVVVTLRARNTGAAPIGDLTLADPLPAALAFVGPHAGSPEPEVSTDGRAYAGLNGAPRTAVRAVRWKLSAPLAPGAETRLAFDAAVR